MFFSKKLEKFENIKHCFFSRKNGFSKNLYEGLNCGMGSDDNKENVLKNLELVSKKIGCKKESLITLNQKHTSKVIFFNSESDVKNKLTWDAIVSKVKNIGISILTADCASIFFYDPKNKIVGCAHAGWKGAFKEIVKKVIIFFKKKGSNVKDLIVVIGPCISVKNYEIKKDFLRKFLKKDKKNKIYFKFSHNKIFFDLIKYISFQIKSFGINKLEIINKDTFSRKNSYFSARRSLVKKENDYGRNISLIMIN